MPARLETFLQWQSESLWTKGLTGQINGTQELLQDEVRDQFTNQIPNCRRAAAAPERRSSLGKTPLATPLLRRTSVVDPEPRWGTSIWVRCQAVRLVQINGDRAPESMFL